MLLHANHHRVRNTIGESICWFNHAGVFQTFFELMDASQADRGMHLGRSIDLRHLLLISLLRCCGLLIGEELNGAQLVQLIVNLGQTIQCGLMNIQRDEEMGVGFDRMGADTAGWMNGETRTAQMSEHLKRRGNTDHAQLFEIRNV